VRGVKVLDWALKTLLANLREQVLSHSIFRETYAGLQTEVLIFADLLCLFQNIDRPKCYSTLQVLFHNRR
jgi:hypothetical protein